MISRILIFLFLILAVAPASAGETTTNQDSKINVQLGAASSKSETNSNSWNTSLRGKEPEDDGEGVEPGPSELTMTVYDRRRGHGRGKGFGPLMDDRGRRMEMDVTSELETCPDGNTRGKAVRIGAWRYRVDGSCEDFWRGGHISVDLRGGNTMITTRADASKSPDEEPRLRCESSGWTCRME